MKKLVLVLLLVGVVYGQETVYDTVAVFRGSGAIKTGTFRVKAPWRVLYKVHQNAWGWSQMGVNLYQPSGDFVEDLFIDKNASGNIYGYANCYESGTFYMDVIGNFKRWRLIVFEVRQGKSELK